MVKLGQAARFSTKGDRNAHVGMDDALENRGYALWLACQGKIRTNQAKKVPGPAERGVGSVMGYEIEVNLKRKVYDIWPGLNQRDRHTQESFIAEIYAYLRASGNACCIRQPGIGPGGHGIPVWWIRETWNDVKAVGIYRPTELSTRERRLTPEEAGETREPAPVSVRQREEEAAAREAAVQTPEQTATTTDERTEQILKIVQNAPQPIYQREIVEKTGIATLTVGRHLRELQEAGKIFRRLETKQERPEDASGRYRFVYWSKKKIPARTEPFSLGNQTMERVWGLKPGEQLRTSWMSPGNQAQVKELVEQGLLEYVNEGTKDEKIRLAPAVTPGELTEATEETVQVPEEPTPAEPEAVAPPVESERLYTGMEAIGKAISQLVEAEVQKRMGPMAEELHRLRDEARLIDALRGEVAEEFERAETVTRERNELKQRLEGIRASLGM